MPVTGGARRLAVLARFEALAAQWWPLAAAVVLGVASAWLLTRPGCVLTTDGEACVDFSLRLTAVRFAGLFIALAVPFALDDPARATTSHLATPTWLRDATRLVVLVPVAAAGWGAAAWIAQLAPFPASDPAYPVGRLALEAAGLVALAAAVGSLVAARPAGGRASPVATLAVLAVGGLAFVLPGAARLFPGSPEHEAWNHAPAVWAALLAATVVAWVAAAVPRVARLLPSRLRRV